ncbi:MAG TPA: YggT family protein [Actinomycetota bacterium]|jgi:YggT family protein|nr:YggT family protein [Actinomycetota bacterium]
MTAAGNIVLSAVCVLLTVYWFILLAQVLLSWAFVLGVRRPYSGPGRVVMDALDAVTYPVLRPLRSLIPPVRMGGMGLDLSVLLAFVILWVLRVALGC